MFGFHRSSDSRSDHEEEIALSRGDEGTVPVDQLDQVIFTHQDVGTVNVPMTEDQIERPGL